MLAVRRLVTAGALIAVAAGGAVTAVAGTSTVALAAEGASIRDVASPATSSGAPLVVRFARVTTPIATPPGAAFQGVRVIVTGGRGGAARAVSTAMTRHVTALRTAFAAAAASESGAGGTRGWTFFDAMSGLTARSARYLSIRIDESMNFGGAHPSNVSHAYVFDLATGREVSLAKLFASTATTDKVIRARLVAANRRAGLSAADVAGLSIVADRHGSTAPLSCYPTAPGLHCIVDQGAVVAHALGPLEATVPWRMLTFRR